MQRLSAVFAPFFALILLAAANPLRADGPKPTGYSVRLAAASVAGTVVAELLWFGLSDRTFVNWQAYQMVGGTRATTVHHVTFRGLALASEDALTATKRYSSQLAGRIWARKTGGAFDAALARDIDLGFCVAMLARQPPPKNAAKDAKYRNPMWVESECAAHVDVDLMNAQPAVAHAMMDAYQCADAVVAANDALLRDFTGWLSHHTWESAAPIEISNVSQYVNRKAHSDLSGKPVKMPSLRQHAVPAWCDADRMEPK